MKRTTKNILTKIAYLCFTAAFVILAVSAKTQRDRQAVGEVGIVIDHTSGYFFITETDVQEVIADLLPDSGVALHVKDLKDLETKLEESASVEDANVFVDNIGQLSIEVTQRRPEYRVVVPDGRSYYVDRNGVKFPVSTHYTARVPVVTGFISDNGRIEGSAESAMHKDLRQLFSMFSIDPFWASQFGQINVTKEGYYELVPRAGHHIVQLGTMEDVGEKLKRLRVFYREGMPRAGWDTYRTINVEYKDQVVCKK